MSAPQSISPRLGVARSRYRSNSLPVSELPVTRGTRVASGRSVQAFTPGRDRAASRRPLEDDALDAQTDCFGISPDGQRITLALEEVSRHLVMIDGVPGAGR